MRYGGNWGPRELRGRGRRGRDALPEHCFAARVVGALTSHIYFISLETVHADMKSCVTDALPSPFICGDGRSPFPPPPTTTPPPQLPAHHDPKRPSPPYTPSPVPLRKSNPPSPPNPRSQLNPRKSQDGTRHQAGWPFRALTL